MVRRRSNSSNNARLVVGVCSPHWPAADPLSVHSAGIKDRLPSGKITTQCRRFCRCVCPRTAND
jgi:hypothetical protein